MPFQDSCIPPGSLSKDTIAHKEREKVKTNNNKTNKSKPIKNVLKSPVLPHGQSETPCTYHIAPLTQLTLVILILCLQSIFLDTIHSDLRDFKAPLQSEADNP